MRLTCRFAFAVAAIALLITLSVLGIVSFGEGFRTVVSRERELNSRGKIWRRYDAGTPVLLFPWKWQSSAEDTRDDFKEAFNTIVTITVCTPVDNLPATANPPTSAAGHFTKDSLEITSAKSTLATQESLQIPIRNSSSSAVICHNDTLAKHQQYCIPSTVSSALNLSSATFQILTSFGTVPSSIWYGLASQTISRSSSRSVTIFNDTTSAVDAVDAVAAGSPSNTATASGSAAAIASYGESSVLKTTSTRLGGEKSTSGSAPATTSSVQNLLLSFTSSLNTIPSKILPSMLPVGSISLPSDASSMNSAKASLQSVESSIQSLAFNVTKNVNAIDSLASPIRTTALGSMSSSLDSINSISSSALPGESAVPSTILSSVNIVNASASSGFNGISRVQELMSSIISRATGNISSSLPVVAAFPSTISSSLGNADSVDASTLPIVTPIQNLASISHGGETAVAGSTLPSETPIPAVGNSASINTSSIFASILATATNARNLSFNTSSKITTIAVPFATLISTDVNGVAKTSDSATTSTVTSTQGFLSSVLSNSSTAVVPIVTSVESLINGDLTSVNLGAPLVLRTILPVQIVMGGDGSVDSSILRPIASTPSGIVHFVPSVLGVVAGSSLLKEAAKLTMTTLPIATFTTNPAIDGTARVVTVTRVVSLLTAFTPKSPPTTSI